MTGWRKEDPLPDWSFKAIHGQDRVANRDAQDAAAYPRGRRLTRDDGEVVTARIRLRRQSRGKRIYALLHWYLGNHRYQEFTVCEVTSKTSRADNLRHAWNVVHDRELLTPEGRTRETARKNRARRQQ
ncbi:hypothetical protein ACMYYO_11145 [Dermacoccaceae bacterium W4C1]